MDITVIEGVYSFYYFELNQQKVYLFGDLHGSHPSCPYHCDYFNYTFDKISSYEKNCTSIGVLLHTWLTYNNDFQIKTNIYIEETINTTPLKRFQFNERDPHIQVLTSHFDQDMSWLPLVNHLLESSSYSPHVTIHPVDIRGFNQKRVSPFYINDLYYYVKDYIVHKDDIIFIIKTLVTQYKQILNYLFFNNHFILNDMVHLLDEPLQTFYRHKLQKLNHLMVIKNGIKMHPIAASLLTLKTINKKMYHYLIHFIQSLADELIIPAITTLDQDINQMFQGYMDNPRTKTEVELNDVIMDLFLTHYHNILTPLSAYTMDMYLLAQFLIHTGEEAIIYTGAAHIDIVVLFFQSLGYDPLMFHQSHCIIDENLPSILPANLYRQYVLSKQNV
jgi:hypothetical protein